MSCTPRCRATQACPRLQESDVVGLVRHVRLRHEILLVALQSAGVVAHGRKCQGFLTPGNARQFLAYPSLVVFPGLGNDRAVYFTQRWEPNVDYEHP